MLHNSLLSIVKPETYTAFGNDGNHFNGAINFGTNTSVTPDIANALHNASDHLPVFVDIQSVFRHSEFWLIRLVKHLIGGSASACYSVI